METWYGPALAASPVTRVHQLAVRGHSGRAPARLVGGTFPAWRAGEATGVVGAGTVAKGEAVCGGIGVRASPGRRATGLGRPEKDVVSCRQPAVPRAAQTIRAPSAVGESLIA